MDEKGGNFLLLPFPAFGHITALLELARKIVVSGYHVTFLVSQSLLSDMRNRQMLTPADENTIRFIGMQDDVVIPPDITSNPGLWKAIYVKLDIAYDKFLSQIPIRSKTADTIVNEFVQLPPVDVVVIDIALTGVPFRVPRLRGIPVVGFSPFGGFMTTRILSTNEATPAMPDEDLYKELAPEAIIDTWKRAALSMKEELLLSDGLVINSFETLEPNFKTDFMTACPKFAAIKSEFMGPILPPSVKKDENVEKWLDFQDDRSVVYFSFGSITILNPEQVREISKTLISLERPFIWSLPAVQQSVLTEELRESIERQFDHAGAPYLILSWAPQKMILQHKAIRFFVSHCGWNSTLEGIYSGVPIVAWPMFGDQHDNADMVVNSGIGLRIDRVDMKGPRIVQQEELTKLIERVAQWNSSLERNTFFTTAQKLSLEASNAVLPGGSSTDTFNSLLNWANKNH